VSPTRNCPTKDNPAQENPTLGSQPQDNRAIVVGTGPAGLVAALALARQGAAVTLVGQEAPETRGRTIALFDGSVRLLAELGVWDRLAPLAAPLRRLRIVDDTDNLFRWRALSFEAREIGLDAFGWNIEVGALAMALRDAASAAPGIRLIDGLASAPHFGEAASSDQARRLEGAALSGRRKSHAPKATPRGVMERGGCGGASIAVGGQRLEAALIVAADGQRSKLREAAGIAARFERLPQTALTAIMRHELPHDDVSTEFHTRGGPCTLVPLPGTTSERAEAGLDPKAEFKHASSLVWMLRRAAADELAALEDEAFSLAVERRVHSTLGRMQVTGRRGAVPLSTAHVARLSAPRLALVGEAAHAFPPIGAQGLNLGLRDASTLAALVGEALREGRDIGGSALLDDYDRDRRADIATRTAAVTLMNRSLLSSFLPADLMRGLGMAALDLIGPLRRLVMREGVEPGFRR
jgi:2-octaprenyl-6-methoxyphenol hydroxylase